MIDRMRETCFILVLAVTVGYTNGKRWICDTESSVISGNRVSELDENTSGPSVFHEQPSKIQKFNDAASPPRCTQEGYFAMEGLCNGYYYCHEFPSSGEYHVSLHYCSNDSVYDETSNSCVSEWQASLIRPECVNRNEFEDSRTQTSSHFPVIFNATHTNIQESDNVKSHFPIFQIREKRYASVKDRFSSLDTIFKGMKDSDVLPYYLGGESALDAVENVLLGMRGKLNSMNMTSLHEQVSRRITSRITQLLVNTKFENIKTKYDVFKDLIENEILEDHTFNAIMHGLIRDNNPVRESNSAQIKVSLKEVENFINQKILKSISEIQKGFEIYTSSSNETWIKSTVSKFITIIKVFKNRLEHLQSLPGNEQVTEVRAQGGIIDFLLLPTIQNALKSIVHNGLELREAVSDNIDLSGLSLLNLGLKIHTTFLSFAISFRNVVALKSIFQTDLSNFNQDFLKLKNTVNKAKAYITYVKSTEFQGKVNDFINNVEKLPYASKIDSFAEKLNEKKIYFHNLIADTDEYIRGIILDSKPETLNELDFSASNISLPVGKWENGNHFSYAIQYISKNAISEVSSWSQSFLVQDKAHPILRIPGVEKGIIRLVYRKFDDEKPELVAILTDPDEDVFRDINKDLIDLILKKETVNTEEMKDLIDDGADVDFRFTNFMTPLHFAAANGNTDVMAVLINANADKNAKSLDNQEPIHLSALSGMEGAINYLISIGADVNVQTKLNKWTPLHIAVANSHSSVAKSLLLANAMINVKDTNGLTPLHVGLVINGDSTDVLLDNHGLMCNIKSKGGLLPLDLAAGGSTNTQLQTFSKCNDIGINSQQGEFLSPIHFASINDNVDVLVTLISHGSSLKVVDKFGSTPLHYATFFGNVKAVLVLIQINPSLKDALNNDGKTSLQIASENENNFIVHILSSDFENIKDIISNELKDHDNAIKTQDISTKIIRNCAEETIEGMVSNMEDMCSQINDIDVYVNLVNFMLPLSISYEDHESYSKIIKDFNKDLITAKSHTILWRNGDSIVNGIKKTFDLAKKFGPQFNRKYVINQKHIQEVKKHQTEQATMKKIQKEVAELEKNILSMEAAQKLTKQPSVISFFNQTLSLLRNNLERKKRMLSEDFVIIKELQEIAQFLEYVKEEVETIVLMAVSTREKIEDFENYLILDMGVFERHSESTKKAIITLTDEIGKDNQTLTEMKVKIQALERQVAEEKQRVWDLQEDIQDSYKNLREMRRDLLDKIQTSRTRKGLFAILTPLVIGIFPLIEATNDENEYAKSLQIAIKDQQQQVNDLSIQIDGRNKEIVKYREQLVNNTDDSKQIPIKMHQLSKIGQDLESLLFNSNTLIQALRKALVGVTIIKDVFHSISDKLDNMIHVATTAGNAAERLNAKYFIYNEISMLRCNWDDVYIKLMNINECTKNHDLLNLQ